MRQDAAGIIDAYCLRLKKSVDIANNVYDNACMSPRKTMVGVRVDPVYLAEFREIVARDDRTFSWGVRQAIRDFVHKHRKNNGSLATHDAKEQSKPDRPDLS